MKILNKKNTKFLAGVLSLSLILQPGLHAVAEDLSPGDQARVLETGLAESGTSLTMNADQNGGLTIKIDNMPAKLNLSVSVVDGKFNVSVVDGVAGIAANADLTNEVNSAGMALPQTPEQARALADRVTKVLPTAARKLGAAATNVKDKTGKVLRVPVYFMKFNFLAMFGSIFTLGGLVYSLPHIWGSADMASSLFHVLNSEVWVAGIWAVGTGLQHYLLAQQGQPGVYTYKGIRNMNPFYWIEMFPKGVSHILQTSVRVMNSFKMGSGIKASSSRACEEFIVSAIQGGAAK